MKLTLVLGVVAAFATTSLVAAQPASQRVRERPVEARPPVHGPASRAEPNRAAQMPDFSKPFAPTGLTSTTDVQVCTQHGGFGAGLACKALLPQGRLVLVWSYANGPVPAAGFHVYRVDGGTPTRVDAQTITPDLKIFIVDPPPGGYAGACYAVSAYASGGQESALTPGFCSNATGQVQTAELSPIQARSIARRHLKNEGVAPSDMTDDLFSTPGNTEVGYHYGTSKSTLGDSSQNLIYRSGLLFDLSSLTGMTIRSAHLKMTVDTAYLDPSFDHWDTPSDHRTSCVAKIGVGLARWWNYGDWIEDSIVLQPGEYNGPDISIDVTPIVQGWRSGQPNFGLVLQGEDENLNAFTEESCITAYVPSSIKLVVEYQ